MKAEILADGTLVVTPETPVEAYALKFHHQANGVVKYNCDSQLHPDSAVTESPALEKLREEVARLQKDWKVSVKPYA